MHCDRRCDLGPPPEGGGSRIRILEFENRVNVDSHDVSISMKRYAAVKVRGAAPREPDAGRTGPVGPALLELNDSKSP